MNYAETSEDRPMRTHAVPPAVPPAVRTVFAMDVVQDLAQVVHTLMPITGTHLDLTRYAMGIVAGAPRQGDLFDRLRAISSAFEGAIAAIKRGGDAQLTARKSLPPAFGLLVAFHVAVLVGSIMYPLVIPQDRGWDLAFLTYIAAVYVHWWLLCGECVLSYFEKCIFYESYTLGAAPDFHWFVDIAPWQVTVLVSAAAGFGLVASWLMVLDRNFRRLDHSIVLALGTALGIALGIAFGVALGLAFALGATHPLLPRATATAGQSLAPFPP